MDAQNKTVVLRKTRKRPPALMPPLRERIISYIENHPLPMGPGELINAMIGANSAEEVESQLRRMVQEGAVILGSNRKLSLPKGPRPEQSYLCLTRDPREGHNTIVIGDIEIEIVEVRGDRVRVGIRAPRNKSVHRKEMLDIITSI